MGRRRGFFSRSQERGWRHEANRNGGRRRGAAVVDGGRPGWGTRPDAGAASAGTGLPRRDRQPRLRLRAWRQLQRLQQLQRLRCLWVLGQRPAEGVALLSSAASGAMRRMPKLLQRPLGSALPVLPGRVQGTPLLRLWRRRLLQLWYFRPARVRFGDRLGNGRRLIGRAARAPGGKSGGQGAQSRRPVSFEPRLASAEVYKPPSARFQSVEVRNS